MTPLSPYRSGYTAIIGWPNVGKSTFLNTALGVKLSIVTPKPQTTRESILGIHTTPNAQLIFLDTPGWLKPGDALRKAMRKSVMRSLYDDADVVLWLLEPTELNESDKELASVLGRIDKPLFIAVNKVDLLSDPKRTDDIRNQLSSLLLDKTFAFFSISAKTKMGVSKLVSALEQALPEGEPFFPEGQLTDRWERFYVTELVREKIFEYYQQEIPHACAVVVDEFNENKNRKDHIKLSLIVESESQKGIVVGKKGNAIKKLSEASRKEIEEKLGRPVFLELIVKVHKNWRKDLKFIKNLHPDYT